MKNITHHSTLISSLKLTIPQHKLEYVAWVCHNHTIVLLKTKNFGRWRNFQGWSGNKEASGERRSQNLAQLKKTFNGLIQINSLHKKNLHTALQIVLVLRSTSSRTVPNQVLIWHACVYIHWLLRIEWYWVIPKENMQINALQLSFYVYNM